MRRARAASIAADAFSIVSRACFHRYLQLGRHLLRRHRAPQHDSSVGRQRGRVFHAVKQNRGARFIRRQRALHFLDRPRVVTAVVAFERVGVLMRVERMRLRIEQLAIHVADDRFRDPREILIAARFERVAVRVQRHRVVVAELLEMRHAPLRIGRVAMKSAAKLIEHSASGDFFQRVERHRRVLRMPVEAMRERQFERREIVKSRALS